MKNWLFIAFIVFSIKTYAQNIQGKIVDENTGTPIPFVSVNIIGSDIASVSNENGDFLIKAKSFPVKIRFSHVSYSMAETTLNQTENNLIIKLKAAAINLQEVSVNPKRGYNLLKEALTKADENKINNHFLTAFYRQLSSVNNTPSQINEIFYDLKWNTNRVNGWLAKQTRFAETKENKYFSISNQSYFTFISSGYLIQNKTNAYINLKNLDNYTIEIDSYIEKVDQDIAVITCKLKKPKKSLFYADSKYFIGVDDHKVYRLENHLFNLPLKLSIGTEFKFPPIANTVATFKNAGGSTTILESVSTKMYFSLISTNRIFTNNQAAQVAVSSLLTVIKEDENLKSANFISLDRNTKDKNVIESVKYNADFWKNNPIVKQTAMEDKFIKMMESQNAFGTMVNP